LGGGVEGETFIFFPHKILSEKPWVPFNNQNTVSLVVDAYIIKTLPWKIHPQPEITTNNLIIQLLLLGSVRKERQISFIP
jgi:hypothetical protein